MNDERLIPFLGGLIVGGAAGTAFDNKMQTYQSYYYPNGSSPVYYYPNSNPTYYQYGANQALPYQNAPIYQANQTAMQTSSNINNQIIDPTNYNSSIVPPFLPYMPYRNEK